MSESVAVWHNDVYFLRYANMDFMVLSTLSGVSHTPLTLSYDIAC